VLACPARIYCRSNSQQVRRNSRFRGHIGGFDYFPKTSLLPSRLIRQIRLNSIRHLRPQTGLTQAQYKVVWEVGPEPLEILNEIVCGDHGERSLEIQWQKQLGKVILSVAFCRLTVRIRCITDSRDDILLDPKSSFRMILALTHNC
jgi:hypothetical protein